MSDRHPKRAFAARPGAPDAWVSAADKPAPTAEPFSARLTVDITPALRGRIKIVAFRRGQTVAEMLRALLEREFPADGGDGS